MPNQKKRYSKFIIPISLVSHLIIMLTIFNGYLTGKNRLISLVMIVLSWYIVSLFTKFYTFHRLLKASKVVSRFINQVVIFTLVYFTLLQFMDNEISLVKNLKILGLLYFCIGLMRMLFLFALKKYRVGGGNYRKVIVVGSNDNAQMIIDFLNVRSEYGYRLLGYFSNKYTERENYLGTIESAIDYLLKEGIHELYCSTTELSRDQIQKFIDFCENNLIVFKLIPEAKDVYSKEMVLEYFDYTPVLSLRKLPFDQPIVKGFKRIFDLFFSLIIIILVLSWLTPLLFLIVKLDSKGPLFFIQDRDGLNGKTFKCYKFRSMNINAMADKKQVQREDFRITKIGKFLRKTSIDELPQFFNVLKGEMSVVGPRPHMLFHTEKFAKEIDKYMVRHFVKPGITGLAQVRGFRGEIKDKKDMENRIRLDIYYIENWSFFLDIRIIVLTILNLFKGQEKAY